MNSDLNKRIRALFATLALVTALLVSVAPAATAHACASTDRDACDPDGCVEGENHSHTHQRMWPAENEWCETTEDPPADECSEGSVVERVICVILGPIEDLPDPTRE